MKFLRHASLALLACTLFSLAHAEGSLPEVDNKEAWQQLAHRFAECSAVYNLAAVIKETPDNESSSYRELANQALVAGLSSSERAGLSDAYIESIYSVKYSLWENRLTDKKQNGALLNQAQQCLKETLDSQNILVGSVRTPTAAK